MDTDLLLYPEHLGHDELCLAHVLNSLHQKSCMGPLLGHQTYHDHLVNLVANLELV